MSASSSTPVASWLIDLPLYSPVEIGKHTPPTVKAILTYVDIIDFYCTTCKKDTPFKGVLSLETQNSMASELMAAKSFGMASGFWTQTKFSKELACTRANHKVAFHFQIEDGKLLKIGQYPSIANIHFGELVPYLPALGESRAYALQKAVALAADSAGIGAFVYLKKLFESLLEDAHQQAVVNQTLDKNWDETSYQSSPPQERINMLSKHLPAYLVDHAANYSILTTPLEELTDQDCLTQFATIKTGIFFMVDHAIAQEQYAHRLKESESA